ncbi:MAG: hypothetical protein NVS2B7_01250 [Herpetosiphon sp.]
MYKFATGNTSRAQGIAEACLGFCRKLIEHGRVGGLKGRAAGEFGVGSIGNAVEDDEHNGVWQSGWEHSGRGQDFLSG